VALAAVSCNDQFLSLIRIKIARNWRRVKTGLEVRPSMRLSAREPQAFRTPDRMGGALRAVAAEGDAVRVPELELGEVAMQMDAFHAPLEKREETLDRVGRARVRHYKTSALCEQSNNPTFLCDLDEAK
jgi:hypothetical protein